MKGLIAPTQAELERYSVNDPSQLSVIGEPLFDFATYAAAGQTELTFFQNKPGQGGKTFEDTNMPGQGQLPSPQMFMALAISVEFFPAALPGRSAAPNIASNWNDLYEVFQTGLLIFTSGDVPLLKQGPIGMFPPSYRLAGAAALTGTPGAANEVDTVDYATVAGMMFSIVPVTLPPNQNFIVSLNWNANVAITEDARIGVRLWGFRYRAVSG